MGEFGMDSIARRTAAIVACASLGLLALGAGSASATGYPYCGSLISANSWCGNGINRAYTYNSALYSGGGAVWVCERLLIADTQTQRTQPQCAYSFVEASFGAYPYLTEAEVMHQTGSQHTISGYAVA
jgi:hypothetical protein